jgi:hypothetical protein
MTNLEIDIARSARDELLDCYNPIKITPRTHQPATRY